MCIIISMGIAQKFLADFYCKKQFSKKGRKSLEDCQFPILKLKPKIKINCLQIISVMCNSKIYLHKIYLKICLEGMVIFIFYPHIPNASLCMMLGKRNNPINL